MSEAAPKRHRNSLRGQLIRLVAALGVPLLVLQGWWSYRDYRGARERAETDALAFADATALGVRQFFSAAEDLMGGTARQFGSHGPADEECTAHMRTMKNLVPFLANAIAVDAQGRVACSFLDAPPGATATEWPWWDDMLADPRFIVGEPTEGDFTGSWILPLAAPIIDTEGAFAGAIVGSVELTELSRLFGGMNLPPTHLVSVATADSIIISRSSEPMDRVGQRVPSPTGSDRNVGPGRWVATGPDLEGVARTWGQVEIEPGFLVYVGVPDELVYGPALQASFLRVGATFLVLLLGVIFAGRSYGRIATALHELAILTGTREAGATVALPPDAPDEVTEIVAEFNRTLLTRELAEAAEKRARKRYQSIFDNAVFGLCVSTPDGRLLQANPALTRMLGYESEASLIEIGALALYADPNRHGDLVRSVDSGRISPHELEWKKADGSPLVVRVSGTVIEGPHGEPALETIVQDITDEKRTEEELRHTQKMEAIGRLAGGVAHDFNNLLTVINGNVELLEDDLPDDDALRADLGEIAKATQRAASLTRRLLAFSRQDSRRTRVVNVNEVVSGLGKMLVPLIGENIELRIELGEGAPFVSIDPGELEQVIMNLVLNARDAMPAGGRLVIATGRAEGSGEAAGLEPTRPGVTLRVSDTGTGMEASTASRAFEPFFTTKPRGQGTGLGLSTVYGLVKSSGGTVQLETEPARGTEVLLWFPRAVEVPAPEVPTPDALDLRGTESVLVVEDDELVRAFVARALAQVGYEVLTAENGSAALALLRERGREVDLVLTDVVMPGLGGPELARELAVKAPTTPVLFMSGYLDDSVLSADVTSRPELLVRKPFSTWQLRSRVRAALERQATARSGGPSGIGSAG